MQYRAIVLSLSLTHTHTHTHTHTQKLHLWSIEGEVTLLRKFSGHANGHYILRACFGGAGEDFVVSGSEGTWVVVVVVVVVVVELE